MKIDYNDINAAVATLRRGGVVLYPTDTVWGIGCDATNSDAVKRVYEIKRRAESKALITLVDSIAALERTVDNVPEVAIELIEVSDRPITVVYDKPVNLAPQLLADDGSAAVRVTSEPFSKALCSNLRKPLVSTSANIAGAPTPQCFDEISQEIVDSVDYVCTSRRDEGANANTKPSMVIKISDGGVFKILRK